MNWIERWQNARRLAAAGFHGSAATEMETVVLDRELPDFLLAAAKDALDECRRLSQATVWVSVLVWLRRKVK